ncbi:hypothetical protein [Micromonospora sp. NPDC049171]|uniref:hypothetical protein n=1 Tax=Micromonospora sp. NPDC049171 TaxID=3155770 RepID=UPI0033D75770
MPRPPPGPRATSTTIATSTQSVSGTEDFGLVRYKAAAMHRAPTYPADVVIHAPAAPTCGPPRRATARHPDQPAGRDLPVARAAGHR